MKGQELKILFKEDMAFLTEEVALDFNQVPISVLPVKFEAPAFWTIRVINHIESEKRLFVEVLSYQVGETEFSPEQIKLSDILMSIEKVDFKSINTSGLLSTLSIKKPINSLALRPESIYRQKTPIEGVPINQTYNLPFSVPIKNVKFISGGVIFDKKIEQVNSSIEFKIPNEYIIEEYDAIKNYFSNVLKTKNIRVDSTITIIDGVISSVTATSIEIEKIDSSFIEEVKFEIVNTARGQEIPEDKQLFTIDEYLKKLGEDDSIIKKLFNDDKEILDTLIVKSKTKHYNHLRYLSSKHKYDLQKLRLVHRPFSFVFLIGGSDSFHMVWETLDTQEATYIWSYTGDVKEVDQILEQTENTIKSIIKDGKIDYLSKHEKIFKRVFHDYADLHNGFKTWKEDIEKVITI